MLLKNYIVKLERTSQILFFLNKDITGNFASATDNVILTIPQIYLYNFPEDGEEKSIV